MRVLVVDDDAEVAVGTLSDPDDVRQLVYDAGVQLGRGHPKIIADPHARELRRELIDLLGSLEPRIVAGARKLADATTEAWRTFHGIPPAKTP